MGFMQLKTAQGQQSSAIFDLMDIADSISQTCTNCMTAYRCLKMCVFNSEQIKIHAVLVDVSVI